MICSSASCARLSELNVGGSDFGNAEMEYLSKLSKLRCLNIVDTKVSDQGLSYLPVLTIETLELRGTPITDEGLLAAVRRFPNLKLVKVDRTAVTQAAIDGLKRQHPALVVGK